MAGTTRNSPRPARVAASLAEAARARISEDAEAEVFSSDLQRALQTARVMGDLLHVEPVVDRRLREKSYGEAEGKPQAWLDQRFIPPPAVRDRLRHDEGLPGAETEASFARRIYAVMNAIFESSCDQQIIVSHSATSTSGSPPEVSRNSARTTTSTTA